MRIAVIGCGRVGSELTKALTKAGHSLSVVDINPKAFDKLGDNFEGKMVLGNGADLDVLERANVPKCDVVVAVTDSNCVNIAIALISQKHFGVPKVISRISDPHRIDIYERAGINVLCPTSITASEAQRIILEQIGQKEVNEKTVRPVLDDK